MTISRLNDTNKGIQVIENEEDEKIEYCPDCSQYKNKKHRLGPLIILDPNKPIPADYDNWRQCGYCYKIVPVYEALGGGRIYTDIEGITNPFDFGATKADGVHKKGLKNRMKDISSKKKHKDPYADDKEVMLEVKDGATITGYYTDTDTDKSF